jgi:hypothetical protein
MVLAVRPWSLRCVHPGIHQGEGNRRLVENGKFTSKMCWYEKAYENTVVVKFFGTPLWHQAVYHKKLLNLHK